MLHMKNGGEGEAQLVKEWFCETKYVLGRLQGRQRSDLMNSERNVFEE